VSVINLINSISVLLLEIQLLRGLGWESVTRFNFPTILEQGHGSPSAYIGVSFVFND